MARMVFVFALVMVAIIGMASAQAPKVPLKAAHAPVEAMAPTGSGGDDNTVGPIDDAAAPSGSGGDDAAVAGSVGGPVAAGESGDDTSATAPAPSGASALEVSAVAAAAVAVAGYFF